MKRKINSLQKSLTEKDKALKDLEIKVPKMLADLKKNLLEDESKKKANRDLKESIKRNRNLSGTMKQVEDQLKIKENKLKDAIEEKKKIDLKLTLKEKECKEHSHLISQLECKLLELKRKFSSGELEIEREKKRRNILDARYRELCTEDQVKYELIEKMKTEVFHLGNVAVSREKEIELLNRQNCELQTVIQNHEEKMDQMMKEISEYRNMIERFSIGGCKEVVSVSDEHRDRNTSLDLMVTLKTRRRSSSLIGVVNVGDTSASFTASVHTEIIDDVFLDFMEDEESCMKEGNSMSTTGCSEYSRASSGTYRRIEELDVKVQGLWTKLQSEDNRGSDLQNKKTHFNDSVLRLERDLDESVIQHSELVTKVGVVKRLFE